VKEDLQIFNNISGRSHRIIVYFTVSRCMQFFIGLMKRFGYTQEAFFVPLNKKAHPNL
jgi:hypothetical protein